MILDTENAYVSCMLCPRQCGVNRLQHATASAKCGFCGETSEIRIASAGLHFGEEPPVTGKNGSGTIFITGCTLQCSFCQNYQISQNGMGKTVSESEFADICLLLQDNKAENINLVTGSHAIPAIAAGIALAKKRGLTIPVLWNSSSYESIQALAMLDGLVSVWLPDLKTLNPAIAQTVFRAPDYPVVAKRVIRKMTEMSPLVFDDQNKITSGVIVRHLALPGRMDDSRQVLAWFSKHLKNRALLSLMTQYTPVITNKNAQGLTAFQNRQIQSLEYESLVTMLDEYTIEDGFCQELVQDDSWLPDFNQIQPFSSSLAKPLWHWSCGFLPQ